MKIKSFAARTFTFVYVHVRTLSRVHSIPLLVLAAISSAARRDCALAFQLPRMQNGATSVAPSDN
jgi:hypothetical protein